MITMTYDEKFNCDNKHKINVHVYQSGVEMYASRIRWCFNTKRLASLLSGRDNNSLQMITFRFILLGFEIFPSVIYL